MTAVVIPLGLVEPVLSPEHEGELWAILDALTAAEASCDTAAACTATLALIDFRLRHGLMSRDELRQLLAPYLQQLIECADATPEGRDMLQRIRDDALEAVNGDDYSERAAGALYILHLDGAQNARRHAANAERNREAREEFESARTSLEITALNMFPCLESGYWALEDIEAHILQALRALNRASGDDA